MLLIQSRWHWASALRLIESTPPGGEETREKLFFAWPDASCSHERLLAATESAPLIDTAERVLFERQTVHGRTTPVPGTMGLDTAQRHPWLLVT